jgi:hypothetical protein
MSGDVERVAEALHVHGCIYAFAPIKTCPYGHRRVAQAILAPGGVVAGMVAEAWAGAADEPGEVNTVPTPGQLLRRLADADADQRLEWASRTIENAETVNRCFVHNHVGRIASLERQLRDARDGAAEVRARVEAVLARRCMHNDPECGCGMFDGDELRAALADPDAEYLPRPYCALKAEHAGMHWDGDGAHWGRSGPESAPGAPQGVGPVSVDPGDELGPQIGAESDSEPIIRYAELDDGTEEFDEFIAHNATVHFEAMDDSDFWIGVTLPDGRSWSINCGARNSRAKGYAICEED